MSRRFDDPIPLPRGRQLVTLKDAADYIMKLPKAGQNHERWQTAIHCLIGAAEGRLHMHAEIGMLRALIPASSSCFFARPPIFYWFKRPGCPLGAAFRQYGFGQLSPSRHRTISCFQNISVNGPAVFGEFLGLIHCQQELSFLGMGRLAAPRVCRHLLFVPRRHHHPVGPGHCNLARRLERTNGVSRRSSAWCCYATPAAL